MDQDGPSSTEGHTFGQRQPPLYVSIQKILDKYPDGQIFKEIIQNADDAGATTVHFYLDNRQHDSGSLIYPSLHQFQGPALLSYNNAVFQDKDWQSIQDMQQSVKAEDPFKVGKFGIGFNSVYHITDLPTIVSGNRLAYLDPHEELWLKETGQWYDIDRNAHCSDTFAPFEGLCGFSTRSGAYYNSTLFRFPLRNVSRKKRVSHHTYDIAKLRNLLTALRNEAKCILLFLRSVCKVEVFEIGASGHHSTIFNVSISEIDYDQLSEKRLQFKHNLQTYFERESFGISSNLTEVVRVKVDINDSQKRQISSSRWIVAHQVGSGSHEIRKLAKDLKVFPWIGVALETSARDATSGGRVFCVLPMPQDVNCRLPVHVNGTFSLNDERRELKWRGIERKNDPSAEWNHLLVKELLPSCYANLLLNYAKMVLTPQQFYEAWPDLGPLQNSHWREILTTLLDTLFSNEVISFSRPGYLPMWLKVNSATFVPRGVQLHDAVSTALVGCGVKLVGLSDRIWNALEFRGIQYTVVSPSLTRAHLKGVPGSYVSLDKQHKMELLRYCLSDNQYDDLQGLALLPLANGSFGTFQTTYHSAVYLCSSKFPRSLLPNCDASLVDESIDRSIYAILNALASGGYTNLQLLKAPNVASLLCSAMPNQSRLTLPWSGFNMQWLQRLWGWIPRGELSKFENLLLVPVGNDTVVRLSKSSSVLYIPMNTHYTKSLISALEKLGVECCLQRNHPYIHHSDLSSLMNYFSSEGIVHAVHSASPEYHNISFTNEEASEIVNQVNGIRSLDYQQQAVVRQLPLFKTLKNTSNQFYSVQQVGVAQIEPPNFPLNPEILPGSVILFSGSNPYQKSLLQKISVHCTTTYDILMASVFPVIENESIGRNAAQKIMKEVLEKYKNITSALGHQNVSKFQSKIGGLQFVPVAQGRPKAPNELYSPLEPGLADIFYGEPVFPVDPFSTGKHIKILKLCGLKTTVSKQEVVDIIGTIGLASSGNPQQADEVTMIKARALIEYIKRWENSLSEHVQYAISPLHYRGSYDFAEALKHHFLTKSWMPIEHDPPTNYPSCLPWKGHGYNSHLVSYGSLVLPHEKQSSMALACGSQVYFVNHSLPPAMCRLFQPSSDYLASCMTAHLKVVIQNQDQLSRNGDIKKVVDTIYGYLSSYMNKEFIEEFGTLGECIWLSRHGKFVDPENTSLSENPEFRHNLEPFIYIIHNDEFKDLFTTLGTQETISRDQILEILPKIKDGNPKSLGISNEEAWRLVKAILNWLVDSEDGEILEIDEESLLVPVESDDGWPQLVPAKEVVYTDNSFLQEYLDEGEEEEYTFVHSCITPQMAERFQLTPLSEKLDIAEDAFEDVGQSEPLAVRLRNILKEYKDGLTIIKELLQNADDAEATEMNICYDRRNHASNQKRLFFPGMVECHGPALVVHNNAKFAEEDFRNITKLAGATKEKKALKIGKFGIGFCSVYHITDIPSFVSDKYLYIFDPTLKYLKDNVKNPAQPGKRVSFTSRFIQKSQQLAPYRDLFEFDPKSEYEGTTFRFPFRTATSELSEKLYKERDVTQLKEDMKESASKLILFLPHINRITFSQISDGESDVNVMMSITKKSEKLAENRCIEQITCSINDSSEFWLVETSSQTILQKYSTSSVACPLSPIQNKQGCYKVASVKGEVFCFLPLSIKTGLPVHVSSNFAVVNNRRGIWTSDESGRSGEEEVDWNITLMKHAICPAFCGLLEALKELQHDSKLQEDYEYFSLWPIGADLKVHNPWDRCVEAVYNELERRELFYSTSTDRWLMLQESKFLDSDILRVSYNSPFPNVVLDVVNHLEMPVVHLPQKYQVHLDISESIETESSFLEHFFDRIDELDDAIEMRNDVLCLALECYAIELDRRAEQRFQNLDEVLKEHACIPCAPDGVELKNPKILIHPGAYFAKLYDEEEGRFAVEQFCKKIFADKAMKELGIVHNSIPLPHLEERADGIAALFKEDEIKAMKRVKLIIECLVKENRHRYFSNKDCSNLSQISFLPVMPTPQNYVLAWKGRRNLLHRGCDIFDSGKHDDTNIQIAGSQLIFLNQDPPRKGGCGHIDQRVQELLGIRSTPDYTEVISHLHQLVDAFDNSKEMIKFADRSCRKIFEFLEHTLATAEQEERDQISACLTGKPCIWTGNIFVESKAVAERWYHNGPYLYKVPECLERRKYLQTALEIRSSFKGRDLIEALRSLKEEFQDEPLPDNCQEVVKSIVRKLSDSEVGGEFKPIMLPDTKFVLCESTELYHNDMPWAAVDDDYIYIHRIVPLETAVSLGVKLCRTASLEQYTDSDSEFTTMEFGQHEELTKRIQNIIRDYPFDVTILKELLQNADDAKATKMHVILDMRTHSNEHLISETWTDLQGPALLVWNDSVFTENDLKGIQRLGLGSKRSDSETIGQYGIGFNAVYHLTDCPSFLTGGKHFCILDPHRRYVQQATVKHPGVMYKDLDEKFWKKFDGLKQPYLRSGVKNLPEELQGGTLFRFPLRHSLYHVLKSSIMKDMCRRADEKVVSAHNMSDLLEEWAPNMKQALLFLNNVVELKFSVIKDFRGVVHLQNEYRAELDETAHKRRLEFTQSVKKYDEPSTTRDPYITTYQLTIVEPAIKKVKEKREEWLIQKGIGDMEDRDKQWAPVEFVKPKHGIATLLKNAKDLYGQLYCFLPLPIYTSLPVHINGQFILDSTRRNLWVATDHQRGDDKFHWNKDLLDAIASSYALFLERIQEYFPDLEGYSTRQAFEFSVGDYYACFPRIKKVENGEELSGRWLELIKQVFKVLCKRNSPILAVPSNISPKASEDKYVLQWKQLKSEQMPVSQVYFGSTIDHASQQISIFERIGMKITCAPMWVMRHLKDAQCEVPVISKSTVYQFYTQFHTTCVSSKYPCPIQETPFKCVEDFKKFTEYLLTETPSAFLSFSFAKQYQFPREPFGYPLLLNAAEDLTIFNKADKILCSKFSQLFPKCPYKFLHPKLIDCHYLPSYFVTANEQKESVKIVKEVLETVLPAELKNSCVSPESDLLTKFDIREMWVCFSTNVVFKTAIEEVLKVWALLLTKDKRLFRRTSSEQLLPMIASTITTSRRAISYHSQDSVMSVLEDTLRMPILDTSIVSESAINSLCPKVSDRKVTLQNLYYLHREFPFESLTLNGAGTLLRYFAELHLKQESGCCRQLSCLPLFEKMDGKLTVLEGKSVYVWPTGICQEGNEQWLMGMNVVFLKPKGVWTTLGVNEELGIREITAEETYTNFIFPNFFKMNKKDRYCHLRYIRNYLFDNNFKAKEWNPASSSFISKLKNLACIGEDGTSLYPVSTFHTDQKPIFRTFPEHFNTIPEDLVRGEKKQWMPFLRNLGLQERVSQDTFLTLCKYVAGGKLKEKTVHGSEVLMNYLFSAYENKQHKFQNSSHFLQTVSKIFFVCPVPVPEYEWIHKPPATSNRVVLPDKTEVTLCMLYGSCLEKHKHLLWAIRPVVHLPEESQISHVCNSLGICMMPSAKDLIDMIKQIAKTRFTDSKLFDTYTVPQCEPSQQQMMDVMTNIFVHLEKFKLDLTQLRSLRCIPVYAFPEEEMGQFPVLVEPTRVIFRPVQETKAFYPYLHSVSNMLYKAKEFLERVGVQDSIELEHMQMVLESVFKASESGAVELEPNTFKVVTEAIVTISGLLEKNKKETRQMGEQVLAEKLTPLYLPSTGRQMHPVDCLVHSQIKDVNLEGTGLYKLWTPFERNIFPGKFCELLPKALRPKSLSMLCFKKVSESCKECETKPDIGDVIEKSLNFSNLQQALVLAVKAAISAGNYPDCDKLCSKFDEHTSEFFESLKIVYVDKLKIEYYLKDSEVSRSVAFTTVDCEIQKEEQELCLYIESKLYHVRVTKVHETIAHHLLLCINDLRESDVQNLKAFLMELLGAQSHDEIYSILHDKQIHYTEEDASSGNPRLGDRVPKSWYDRLDMSNLNIFQAQEWVAYELEDEADIYIFAEVSHPVKLRDETGQPLSPMEMEYIIFTSEGDTTGKKVKSVDLFKFKRGKTAPEDSILPPLSESQEIVLYEGNEEEKPIPTAPVNVQEARQEVNAELDEIWRLPADQRKKAIRRLLLKWHPDKNLNFPDLAEDVFKYIQQELDRRERGDGVSMSNDSGPYQSWRRHQQTWESHASQHKTYQQRSKKRRRSGRGGGGGGGGGGWGSFNRQDFFSNQSFTPPKSEPKSKVWVRQAVADHRALQVLLNESQHDPHLYCHVCFMSHEVAEKALKGAMYGTCGLGKKLHKSHNIVPLAFAVEQAESEKGRGLGDLADNLETKHVYIDTRFPDDQPSKAPYENFTLEGATEAEKCATGILKIVRAIIEVDM